MIRINNGENSFRQDIFTVFCLLITIIMFPGYKAKAQTTADYTWKNVPIGGGGFVAGLITHKTSGDRYCRADVGGAYRYAAANDKWVQLLDWLNESETGFYGVESLALESQNPDNVYMLCGTSYINGGRTAILKSTDEGNSFTYTDVTSNTGVWQNNSCGGSNSEWLNCGGYISYTSVAGSSARTGSVESGRSTEADIIANEFNIYSNPASQGRFTVALPEITGNASISIFDGQGRVLYQKNTDGNKKLEFG